MAKNPFEGVQLVTPNTPTENSEQTTTETPKEETPVKETTPPPGVIDLSGLEDERPFLEKVRNEESNDTAKVSTATVENISTEEADTIYSALVKELSDKGILELEDGVRIETADDLAALFDKTLNTRLEENVTGFVQNFSGAKKMFLEIEDAFDDELVAMRVARDIDYFDRVTPEVLQQENIQKDILGRYLKMKGLNDAEIRESIDEAVVLAKLQEKANTALPQLKAQAKQFVEVKRKEKEERAQRMAQRDEESFNTLINSVDDMKEILPGVELTTRHKNAMKKAMTDIAYTDPETGAQFTELGHKQSSNPQGFEKLIQFYNVLGLFNADKEGNFRPDMSKIVKLTEKQVKRKLDELIREQQQTSIPGQKSSAGTKLNLSFWENAFGE